jgi:hypothetical protein
VRGLLAARDENPAVLPGGDERIGDLGRDAQIFERSQGLLEFFRFVGFPLPV